MWVYNTFYGIEVAGKKKTENMRMRAGAVLSNRKQKTFDRQIFLIAKPSIN